MKQITVTVPDGYESTTHVVLVSQEEVAAGTEFAVTVLKVDGPETATGRVDVTEVVEEVGCGPLSQIMVDAARVVRTGTAVVQKSA